LKTVEASNIIFELALIVNLNSNAFA
jgi:hypothetical protein